MQKSDLEYKGIQKLIAAYIPKGRNGSASFLNWFLENLYRLNDTEADDCICDKQNDKGVDGIYVDEINQEVHIFQTKIREKNNATLGDVDLKNFQGTLKQFASAKSIKQLLKGSANIDLKNLLERKQVTDLLEKGFDVVGIFVTNIPRNKDAVEYLKHTDQIQLYDRDAIIDEYVDLNAEEGVVGSTTLTASSKPMSYKAGHATLYLFPALATELVELDGISDGKLFSQNVRLSLGNTKVNKDIEQTVKRQPEHNKFPLFHNGITVLCKSAKPAPPKKPGGKSTLTLTNYKVVNGAQSLTAFWRNKKSLSTSLRVITKVIEIQSDEALGRQITINSNNQNSIKPRDLKSNDKLQVRLQNEFRKKEFGNYALEIKRGEEFQAGATVITNEDAARLLLAFDLQEPWSTHQVYRLFEELYSDIFGRKDVNACRIIFLTLMMQTIERVMEEIEHRPFGNYRLTKYFFLYLSSQILRDDTEGLSIVHDPASLMKDKKKTKKFFEAMKEILDGIVVDLNLEVDERGDEFDYKSDLKSPQKVASLANKLFSTYQKDVKRKKALTITQALNG
jgi:hypothetical protein